ncbi:precorrin-6A synthase (deacetylating) [Rhodopseudomonas palustris]|uniref:Precorrin-6A synthase [deacetylating] n=1 Tax=Rhodopseudomonas palustris TaxID=1076 RepID=A0A418VH77_RHOPL|nr:precorrin-6A synthase (deacetylating) [Rhodopseudomonas palustris]RJF75456.1 precorrin-6A synthase (deacetylating) [Rhodopseudomonas palustris]
MRKLLLIGMGPGDPSYLTLQAVEALNRASVFFLPDKGAEKAELKTAREAICRRFIKTPGARFVSIDIPQRAPAGDDYRAVVDDWHAAIAARYAALLTSELADEGCGAFLVWGDPTLYDSTLRILDRLRAQGLAIDTEIIPGITAVQALAARHRIALNRIGEPITITTGRKLAAGLPIDADSTVVMLDGDETFAKIDPADLEIYWAANLGLADEVLISGPLQDVAAEISRTRRQVREAKGWVMDIYLLRRGDTAKAEA